LRISSDLALREGCSAAFRASSLASWTDFEGNNKEDWLARRQGFKGKGSGAKEDPSPASVLIIIEPDFKCQ
jgi:hypothetical protein